MKKKMSLLTTRNNKAAKRLRGYTQAVSHQFVNLCRLNDDKGTIFGKNILIKFIFFT